MKKRDKYDLAISYFKRNPDHIYDYWMNGLCDQAPAHSCLFTSAASKKKPKGGCLTMIRQGDWVAQTKQLTEAIRRDKRIPDEASKITIKSLPVFAEWQRKLDKMAFRRRIARQIT